MSKCRVWYHADGKISVTYVDLKLKPVYVRWGEGSYRKHKKYKIEYQIADLISMGADVFEESDDVFINVEFNNLPIKAPQFAGLDFEDKDTSELPQDRADRDRWRGNKLTGIKIDATVILRKDLFQQIDDELAKPSPDNIKIERLRRKLERKEHD